MNNAHKEVMVITKEKRILHDKIKMLKTANNQNKIFQRGNTRHSQRMEKCTWAVMQHCSTAKVCNTITKLNLLEMFEESEEILFSKTVID